MKKTNACPICSELILKNVNIVIGTINSDVYAIMGKAVSEVLLINSGTDTITLTEYGPASTSSYGSVKPQYNYTTYGCSQIDSFNDE